MFNSHIKLCFFSVHKGRKSAFVVWEARSAARWAAQQTRVALVLGCKPMEIL